MIVLVVNRILVLPRHDKAPGRARERAEGTIAAARHVDIENVRAKLDHGPIRRKDLRLILSALLGLDCDAIRGADASALAAANAVLYFVEEPADFINAFTISYSSAINFLNSPEGL